MTNTNKPKEADKKPPNYRESECCDVCQFAKYEPILCEWDDTFWCEKHEIEVDRPNVCDDFEKSHD